MNRLIITLSLALLVSASAFAQSSLKEQEDKLVATMGDEVQYVMPEFENGRVTFKDGTYSNGRFNISTIDQSIKFIDASGEILTLTNVAQVDRIIIGKTLFLRELGVFMAVVDVCDDILLCMCKKIVFDDSKSGAFGMASSTSNIQTIGRIDSDPGQRFFFDPDIKYTLKQDAYLIRKNICYPSSKSAVKKCFPAYKEELKQYTAENKVNYSKFDDVQALFDYVKTLTK